MAKHSKAHILVAGGAGFIGSHMVKQLLKAGYTVTVLDNLSNGHRDAVGSARFIEGEIGDLALLDTLFNEVPIDAVMHFAGLIEVGLSVVNPALYYHNNVAQTLTLMEAMCRHDVKRLVFSSTAAVYGTPDAGAIPETATCRPINPYGNTKHIIELALQDFDHAYGLKSVCLRYFNAAGADPQGELGERHNPESHLLPLILQVASGRREAINVFGNDYATPDGTCIRDYVHVQDLVEAHEKALEMLLKGGPSDVFNLGSGEGHSVMQVIEAVEAVTGQPITVVQCERRSGDPDRLLADIRKAQGKLNWSPQRSLEDMVKHAWQFEVQCLAH